MVHNTTYSSDATLISPGDLHSKRLLQRFARALAISGILTATVVVVSVASKPASKDYIAYWSAGQQLAHHLDPYSYPGVLAIEKTQGYVPAKPLIMLNPPWTLLLMVPLDGCRPASAWFSGRW